ncbi:MAG TPA: bifunctional glutamate N-acetyltransferase/amino-acid acetyltransferase ArgJ [Blastocatellia bacterium]|nr:bifunctional glutamate N-acetyltransferase/amino-acid acetyltransferase ArgJ [Blastocatellia bacterium]
MANSSTPKSPSQNSNSASPIPLPKGFVIATTRCGLKKAGEDLALIVSEVPAVAAAVFTQNLVVAAPVIVSRQHLRHKTHRALVVNSGCANAVTGAEGLANAERTTQLLAEFFSCDPREILVCSTGVIGVQLNMNKLEAGLKDATSKLVREPGTAIANLASAIMTTDTRPKQSSRSFSLGGKRITISGVAKGAGMIHPNMATLLSFVMTDAAISKKALQAALLRAVNQSFNRVTVDGDTSTNDTLAALANGAAGNALIAQAEGADFERFVQGLTDVCRDLAIEVARDGEGMRKLITIHVKRAPNETMAHRIAETIATSPLVKTAIAGEDANWGRILAAAGRASVKFDVSKVDIKLGNLYVAKRGRGLQFDEAKALEILKRDAITITLDLQQGAAEVTEWTCDLTEDYIRINADYRT